MAYEGTTVAVEKSQMEIRKLLAMRGATTFAFGEQVDENDVAWASVSFVFRAIGVRMRVPLKPVNDIELRRKIQRARSKSHAELVYEMREREARRIWRVLHWGLKARMVSVDEDVETFEQAFLPHIVNPSTNRTVFEDLTETGRIELPDDFLALPETTGVVE